MDAHALGESWRQLQGRLSPPPLVVAAHQPARRRLLLILEWPQSTARHALLFDVDPGHPACHLVPASRDTASSPSGPFADRLVGRRLLRVEPGPEPVLWRLAFSPPALAAAEEPLTLALEWTGRSGNMRLLDPSGEVLAALESGGPRPGMPYANPAARTPAAPVELTEEGIAGILRELPPAAWPQVLSRCGRRLLLSGSPRLGDARTAGAGSAAEAAEPAATAQPAEAAGTTTFHLYAIPRQAEVMRVPAALLSPPTPSGSPAAAGAPGEARRDLNLTAEDLGLPAAFVSAAEIPALLPFRTASGLDLQELLRRAHEANVTRTEAERRRVLWRRRIATESARLLRLRRNLEAERGEAGAGPRLRRSAEAILAHLHALRKGEREIVVPGWEPDGGELRVELDPARTPVENAETYFRRARRWERGEPHRKRRLEELDKAVARLSVLDARIAEAERPPADDSFEKKLTEALGLFRRSAAPSPGASGTVRGGGPDGGRSGADAAAVRSGRSASSAGGARSRRGAAGSRSTGGSAPVPRPSDRAGERAGGRRADAGFRPRSYVTSEGWTVLVGRSNEENDWLTHRFAHPEDYWLHAHGVPGSHVVLRREGRRDNPSVRTLEEAASFAAFFSKARHSSKAPVLYTLKKYVRKPRGAKPGLAVCEREKTLMVRPRDPGEGREPEWMED